MLADGPIIFYCAILRREAAFQWKINVVFDNNHPYSSNTGNIHKFMLLGA